MSSVHTLLRAALELPDETEIRTLQAIPHPDSGVQGGKASAIPALVSLIANLTSFHDVPIDLADDLDVRIERSDDDPAILTVTPGPGAVVTPVPTAHVHFEDSSWFLDGRKGPDGQQGLAAVQIERDARIVLLLVDAAHCEVVEMPAADRPELSPPDLGAPPDADTLFAGVVVAPWLQQHVAELATSPAPLDPVAAVGMAARLWSPPDRAARREAMLSGIMPPLDRARAWAKALSVETREAILREAAGEALDLVALIDDLIEAPSDAARDALTRRIVRRREALEGVLWVLAAGGDAQDLLGILDDVDREVAIRRSELPPMGVFAGDPLIEAARALDPDAWWGALA